MNLGLSSPFFSNLITPFMGNTWSQTWSPSISTKAQTLLRRSSINSGMWNHTKFLHSNSKQVWNQKVHLSQIKQTAWWSTQSVIQRLKWGHLNTRVMTSTDQQSQSNTLGAYPLTPKPSARIYLPPEGEKLYSYLIEYLNHSIKPSKRDKWTMNLNQR